MGDRSTKLPKPVNKPLKILFHLLLLCTLSFLLLLGIVVSGSKDQLGQQPETMIILGCQVMTTGPSQSLADRLDKALSYLEQFPDLDIIVSGGQGDNEPTTEAYAMASYLIERGVDETQIFQEGNSRNTHQNLSFSRAIIDEHQLSENVVIVSSGFHLARAKMLWKRVGGPVETLSVLAAPVTHFESFIKSHIREPLALVKSFLFDQGLILRQETESNTIPLRTLTLKTQ